MTPAQIAAKPADKRTPIEQAIFILNNRIDEINDTAAKDSPAYEIAVLSFNLAITDLRLLLPAEREAIEAAYNEGQSDPEIRNCRIEKFCDASSYFTQTYGQ